MLGRRTSSHEAAPECGEGGQRRSLGHRLAGCREVQEVRLERKARASRALGGAWPAGRCWGRGRDLVSKGGSVARPVFRNLGSRDPGLTRRVWCGVSSVVQPGALSLAVAGWELSVRLSGCREALREKSARLR